MNEQETNERIAGMCREILDTEEPFYWHYNLSHRDKDIAIDFLLRAVLGYAEKNSGADPMSYIETKFYGGYNFITNKNIHP